MRSRRSGRRSNATPTNRSSTPASRASCSARGAFPRRRPPRPSPRTSRRTSSGAVKALALAVLVGVIHVHHARSHDSDASFAEVLAAADSAGLDFVVLTDHADVDVPGPLPAIEHAGVQIAPSGRPILVLVGAEFATRDGHLLGLEIDHAVPALGRPGRDVIAEIHAQGGFAVVPHPFSHGGWSD